MLQHWRGLPRKVEESPSLEVFVEWVGTVLSALGTMVFGWRLDLALEVFSKLKASVIFELQRRRHQKARGAEGRAPSHLGRVPAASLEGGSQKCCPRGWSGCFPALGPCPANSPASHCWLVQSKQLVLFSCCSKCVFLQSLCSNTTFITCIFSFMSYINSV